MLSIHPFPKTLVCFSGIRWNTLHRRPQHLLRRFATAGMQVVYVESPVANGVAGASFEKEWMEGVQVIRPSLPEGLSDRETSERMRVLLEGIPEIHDEQKAIFWYYDPAAIRYTDSLHPALVVYDCMDEPEALPNAHKDIKWLEQQLLDSADVVFTSGPGLMKSRKKDNANIHVFPSAVDREHFAYTRQEAHHVPADQARVSAPRLGFYGLLNEHLDTRLIQQMAALRTNWNFVFIGPMVNITEADLPQAANIHYLGPKNYEELPAYLRGWDLALVPLKVEPGTATILPAKVPEYLAAGVRVLSTPLEDLVATYSRKGLVHVASGPEVFINVAQSLLDDTEAEKASWRRQVDAELAKTSWDKTYEQIEAQLRMSFKQKRPARKVLHNVSTALGQLLKGTTSLLRLPSRNTDSGSATIVASEV